MANTAWQMTGGTVTFDVLLFLPTDLCGKVIICNAPALDFQILLFAPSTTSRKTTGTGHSTPQAQAIQNRMQLKFIGLDEL